MPEYPNIIRVEGEPKPQESQKEGVNAPATPKKEKKGPKKEGTARASENVAKTKFKGRALGAILGIALLKGAVEYPIRMTNYAIEKLDALDKVTQKLPFGGISINPFDKEAYFKAYKKIAGDYTEKRLKKSK